MPPLIAHTICASARFLCAVFIETVGPRGPGPSRGKTNGLLPDRDVLPDVPLLSFTLAPTKKWDLGEEVPIRAG